MQEENQSLDILIINSPLFRDKVDGYDEDSLPPLGLGYIATDLLSNGITVELLDAVEESIPLNTLLDTIRRKRPHYVAMNVFTTNLHLIREIVESIDSGVRFIIGGLATKKSLPNDTVLEYFLSRGHSCWRRRFCGKCDCAGKAS